MLLVICWKWNFSLEWTNLRKQMTSVFFTMVTHRSIVCEISNFPWMKLQFFHPQTKPCCLCCTKQVTNSNLKHKQGLYSFEPHGLGLAIILPKKGTQAQEGLKFKPLEPCISQILAGSTHHFTEVEMTAQLCNNCWATYFLLLNQLRLCLLLQSHNQVHGSY